MKNLYFLLLSFVSLALILFSCQDDMTVFSEIDEATTRTVDNNPGQMDYYWYRGEKMLIKQVPNKSYIIFKASDKDAIIAHLEREKISYKPSSIKKYYHSGIDLTDGDDSKAFLNQLTIEVDISPERAYDIREVVYAAPYYYADNGKDIFPLTNLFYVFLNKTSDLKILEELARESNVSIISKYEELPNMYVLACDRDSKGNALEVANSLYETGLFEATEPSFMSFDLATPNDTNYGLQWNLQYQNQYGSYSPNYDINYNEAANVNLIPDASNIIIAVIDQGVELTHSDLTLHSFSWDGVNNSSPSVVYGTHGTNVAGILGAVTNNSIGIAGVASGAKIMSLSHDLDIDNSLPGQLANMIIKATNQGAHVINNSWGIKTTSSALSSAINYAVTNGRDGKGCVLVFCSHNDTLPTMRFPASYTPERSVIAVGATSYNGTRAVFSNYGTNLDLVAPGVIIPTTTTGNSWTTFTGTSAATPHVSGVAALMLAKNPNLYYDEVGFIIQSSANKALPGYTFSSTSKVGGTWNNEVGHGLLNMYSALSMTQSVSYPFSGSVSITGGQTTLNSGGSGYVGTTFTASPNNNSYKYYWSGSYTGTCDRWYVTPNTPTSPICNVSVYLNSGQSGVLAVTCRVYSNSSFIGSYTKYVNVSY